MPEGRPLGIASAINSMLRLVTPDYFRTVGIPLLEGRFFSEADDADAPRVIVINKSMADRYWPDADAVGKRVRLWGETRMIAGIVGDLQSAFGHAHRAFSVGENGQS